MVSSKAVLVDLNLKYRSKFNHGFTNHRCLHKLYKILREKEPTSQFDFQNVQNEVFIILKRFKKQHEIH